ncbi:type II toxin-antitoxin system RelE/ParE family toxin [Methylobacter sp. Wu8]|uniref:type II toxin-antitoxin system RelE/ParE family toxin n=1 Tax=Methylobacter sp. Wu8 TaxID=3118457 RepID=UPI002F34DF25
MSINVDYTLEFKRNIRQLVKKYPSIRQDIEPIIQGLQQGELLGDRIQHSGYVIYKLRVKNSDNRKGKSAGYRIIYYLKTAANIVLVTIYSKSEQSDITVNELKAIIKQFDTGIF